MDYFVLERDQRLGSTGGVWSCSDKLKKGYEAAELEEQVEVSGQGTRDYGCLLEYPVSLVSNELRQVFARHDPQIQTKRVWVMDTLMGQNLDYYLVQMPRIEVNAQLRTSDLGLSKIAYGFVIPQGEVKEQAFFELHYVRKKMLIVGLSLAEQVLREGLYGVAVKRIVLTEDDGTWQERTKLQPKIF
ncbi:hypothetical protein D3C73_657610 [compost metagenome]